MTYPLEFPADPETYKKHLDAFGKRCLREFPHGAFHWKLEFQDRDAPHFHPIFWNLASDRESLVSFRQWLATAWFETAGTGDHKHLLAGTQADAIHSRFGILRYVSGYQSKTDQTRPGWKVGRYWGIVGRANVPYGKAGTLELSNAESLLLWRTARRYMKAVNRERRIRHVNKKCGTDVGARWLLSGRLRQIRKTAPHMAVFEHLPKKLRLKNNLNVNLFCDASFWLDATERLLCQ